MGKFNPRGLLSVDTETTGLRVWQGDRPFAVPLCDDNGNTWYTEWPVDPYTREVTPEEGDLRYLDKLFSNEKLEKVLFNLKFDFRMLSRFGLILKGKLHDMGVAARICFTLENNYRLKPLAKKYANYPDDDEKELQKEVVRCRRIGRKEGWLLHEACEADYWLPRAVDLDSDHCERYATGDTIRNMLLYILYVQGLMSKPENADLARTYKFEMEELWPVLYDMEERGIRIDRVKNSEELRKAQVRGEEEYKELRSMLVSRKISWADDSKEFNPGSNVQLARVLFDPKKGFGLEVHRRTKSINLKTGIANPSTDWKALREHLTHPFVQHLVQYRSALKAQGTYFGNYDSKMIPDHIEPGAYSIHASFNQVGASKTSRTSSNDPNLQNVGDADNNPNSPAPIQAREPFGPRKGYTWYCLDWSQQEVRIFAEIAEEEFMLSVLYGGGDINTANTNRAWGGKGNPHALIAAAYSLELGSNRVSKPEIEKIWAELGWSYAKAALYGFNSPMSAVIAEKWLRRFNFDIVAAEASIGLKRSRTRGKNLTYAKIYGAGINGVIDMLYCTRGEARDLMQSFDVAFPRIVEFCEEYSIKAREQGYIHNLFGRRLYIDTYTAYRAVNYTVQGTAAEQMKRAMVACKRYIGRTTFDAHIIMPIHDELVFEIKNEHTHLWFLRGLRNTMQAVSQKVLQVPMPVEVSRVREFWNRKEKMPDL